MGDDKHPLEMEARMFWCCASAYRRLVRIGAPDKEVSEALDEVDWLAMWTGWPQIFSRVNAMLPEAKRKKEMVR